MSTCRSIKISGVPCLLLAFVALNVQPTFAASKMSVMPGECETFCDTAAGKTHPICKAAGAATEDVGKSDKSTAGAVTKGSNGGVVLDDTETASSSGLPLECETFCDTAAGAGNALCVQAEQIANMTSSRGSTGLMGRSSYGKNTMALGNADTVAARASAAQLAETKALGSKVQSVKSQAASTAKKVAQKISSKAAVAEQTTTQTTGAETDNGEYFEVRDADGNVVVTQTGRQAHQRGMTTDQVKADLRDQATR